MFAPIIAGNDYDSALRFYNSKGIVSVVAGVLDVNRRAYCNMVVGIVRSSRGTSIADELRSRIS